MSEKFRAAAQRENRTLTQTAARMSGRIHSSRTKCPFAAVARMSASGDCTMLHSVVFVDLIYSHDNISKMDVGFHPRTCH